MRGARTSKDPAPHLLAALDQATGAVLNQQRVAGKSTQTGTAQWITRRGGHYLLTPLGNQKTLRKTLKALPWKSVPSVSSVDTGHGRRVRRTAKAIEAPAWVDFPGAAQVVQLQRTRTIKSRKHVEVVYPGLLPAYDRCPARGRRGLDPRALGNREPTSLGQGRGLR